MPNFDIEERVQGPVAGVDEAGRGPWAGPVVSAAVILDRNNTPNGLNDSKKLSVKKRDILFETLNTCADIGVGIASVQEIDQLNILQATFLAMQRAVKALQGTPALVLIDGNQTPQLPYPSQTVIKGDSTSLSIAAASIIAKVTRDRIMQELDTTHPHYAWAKNAGYGTKDHQDGIAEHGITEHHRKSFKPIAKLVSL